MARRRRLDMPDSETLANIARAADIQRSDAPTLGPTAPPIARVAAETAGRVAAEGIDARVKAAVYEADALRWREAAAEGRVVLSLPLVAIETDHLARDRMRLDNEEMSELRASIRAHGLRLPIEVLEKPGEPLGAKAPVYGLISGWRRLQALRSLWAETGDERYSHVKALVRGASESGDAYVAMVEENEIRSGLSHYERGRIAVVATAQGAFATVDAAVATLFGSGSKAKRSKIRSFALIHEELGDVLSFGPDLSERAGLRLAGALRAGAAGRLRRALARKAAIDAAQEWSALEEILVDIERLLTEADPQATRRKGRGRFERKRAVRDLGHGVVLEQVVEDGRLTLHLRGVEATEELLDRIAENIARLCRKSG